MAQIKHFDFVLIGATGEQGSIAARDLLGGKYKVLLCGRKKDKIKTLLRRKNADFAYVDLRDSQKTSEIIKKSRASIVLNCAELAWNIQAMEACLDAGVHYLDLGGLQEMTVKQFKYDRAYKQKQLLALLGCGSTPGIANVMAAYAVEQLDRVDHIDLGFAWDSNIKKFVLPYSFESMVYELTTPPVVLENGRFKTAKACAIEGITTFMGVGRQAIYCIVHSEVVTFYRYFKKKGLQSVHYKAGFPAHSYRVIEILMELGFASKEAIDFTSQVLSELKQPSHYKETEDLWVKVIGTQNGRPKTIEMDCLVRTSSEWRDAGSNVDTGRTIAIMAQMLLKGQIQGVGVMAPEICVPHLPFFKELEARGMKIYRNGKRVVRL